MCIKVLLPVLHHTIIHFYKVPTLILQHTGTVSVYHTFSPDGDQFHALAGNKVECLVDISNLVESHLASIWLGQGLTRYHFQQKHQLQAISEVFFDIFDRCACLAQMRVAPCRECLKQKVALKTNYTHNKTKENYKLSTCKILYYKKINLK